MVYIQCLLLPQEIARPIEVNQNNASHGYRFHVLTGVIGTIDDGANGQTKRDAEFASRGTSTSYKMG